MTLYFSLGTTDGSAHDPCICCAELDTLLEVLNSFVATGNVLEWAYLVDEDGVRIDLPIDAFDGLPVARSLHQLTQAYQQVLGA